MSRFSLRSFLPILSFPSGRAPSSSDWTASFVSSSTLSVAQNLDTESGPAGFCPTFYCVFVPYVPLRLILFSNYLGSNLALLKVHGVPYTIVACFIHRFGVPRTRRRRVDACCDHHLLHRTSPRSRICFGILLCPDPAGFPPVIGAGAALRRSHAPSPDHSPSGSDGEHLRGDSACTRALILRQYYLILGWRCRDVSFMTLLDKSPGALFSSSSLSLRPSPLILIAPFPRAPSPLLYILIC